MKKASLTAAIAVSTFCLAGTASAESNLSVEATCGAVTVTTAGMGEGSYGEIAISTNGPSQAIGTNQTHVVPVLSVGESYQWQVVLSDGNAQTGVVYCDESARSNLIPDQLPPPECAQPGGCDYDDGSPPVPPSDECNVPGCAPCESPECFPGYVPWDECNVGCLPPGTVIEPSNDPPMPGTLPMQPGIPGVSFAETLSLGNPNTS